MKSKTGKILIWVSLTIVIIFVFIALTGIYKFNHLSGQEGYDVDGNKIEVKE